jgi:FtsZ-binding cell division protein ZapB
VNQNPSNPEDPTPARISGRKALVFGFLIAGIFATLIAIGNAGGNAPQDPSSGSSREVKQLRSQVYDLQQENRELKAQLAEATTAEETTVTAKGALTPAQANQLKAENAALEAEKSDLEDQVSSLQSENSDLKDQLAEAKKPVASGQQASQPTGQKHVKVVAYAATTADYNIGDDTLRIADGEQISGTRTFEYDVPAKDGFLISLMSDDQGYVSLKVYENGQLTHQDEDASMGWAQISY